MAIEITKGMLIGERYRLEHRIGEGGMGVVWAAQDVVTHQRHALKLVKNPTGDPAGPRRLVREARAAAAVHHPNVVNTLDVIELDDGSPVLVMELLEGESLRDRLARERTLGVRDVAEIGAAVVSAVGTAHALGIVHRDLKPENIFLSRNQAGEPVIKVLDFGIAKLTATGGDAMRSSGVTTGAVLGTPAYMAPEQVFGESDLDHRADIWAIGVILYECLAGVLPTAGDNVGQVFKNVLGKPFEPLEQLVPDLPRDLARLIARMTSRERSERPADLREVLAVLQGLTNRDVPRFGRPAEHLLRTSALAATMPIDVGAQRPARDDRPASPAVMQAEPPRTELRRRIAVTGVVIVAVFSADALLVRGCTTTPTTPIAQSPLDPPDSKLACPVLEVAGFDEPAGWLGAAAAATACERARVILGGRPERTVVPAELLGLPRGVVDDFPADPYIRPDARERSLAAARSRAAAYLDGRVTHGVEFHVTLELRAPDQVLLGRSEGSGTSVHAAVRDAMARLVSPTLIPRAAALDPALASWSRTPDVDAALAVLDLNLAMANNAGGLQAECASFEPTSHGVGELGPAWRWLCARTLGQRATDVELGASDRSPEALATRIRIQHVVHRIDAAADIAALHLQFKGDKTSWGRSLVAATLSCMMQSSDPDRAYDLAIQAVAAEPKNPDGQPCDPWSQLMTMAQHRPIADSAVQAMQAWQPWSSIGWFMQGLAARDPLAALGALRRAYELSPFNTEVAGALADRLLAAGQREHARRIARDQASGENPVNQVEGTLLMLRIEASQANFRAALERAHSAFAMAPDDAGWVRAQRFDIAWRALEIAMLLGRAGELSDTLVATFLDPAPPALDASALRVPAQIAAICALASPEKSPRCFQRFAALRAQLSGAITAETDGFLRGAECYARQDVAGAARAWRPLLRGSAALATVLPGAMAEVFDRAGDRDLAEQVDALAMSRAGELNGATLGHVRAAHRAFERGDRARARGLASTVVAAWQLADDTVPAVDDMRRLLAQLGAR